MDKSYGLAAGTTLDDQLGFVAQSVHVDNFTDSYIYVAGVQRFVEPHVVRATFQLSPAAGTAQIKWIAPPGVTQIAPVSGQQAQLNFTDELLPPSPGFSSQVTTTAMTPVTYNSVQRGTVAIAAGVASGTFALPVAVNPATSTPKITGVSSDSAFTTAADWEGAMPFIALTAPATVTITRDKTLGNIVVSFQVIDWANAKAVQTAQVVVGAASVAVPINPVDTTKCDYWLLGMVTAANLGVGEDVLEMVLTNATTLTFTRGANAGTTTWAWILVEMV